MKQFIKTYWKTLLFFTAAGLFGGFIMGIFLLDSYPDEIRQQLSEQGISDAVLGLVTALQSAGYGAVLGAIGIFLGKKTGLWKDETSITKKPFAASLAAALIGGLAMILLDVFFFGRYSEVIMDSYAAKPSVLYILGCVIYGGVIEEVMLRLFFMTLIAFVLHKALGRRSAEPTTAVLVISNIIAAALFAAGHLPATFMLLGKSPLILARCFLMNGGIGLMFGWLYRKYGLRYAMIAHGGCHIVSKLVWLLFV